MNESHSLSNTDHSCKNLLAKLAHPWLASGNSNFRRPPIIPRTRKSDLLDINCIMRFILNTCFPSGCLELLVPARLTALTCPALSVNLDTESLVSFPDISHMLWQLLAGGNQTHSV